MSAMINKLSLYMHYPCRYALIVGVLIALAHSCLA